MIADLKSGGKVRCHTGGAEEARPSNLSSWIKSCLRPGNDADRTIVPGRAAVIEDLVQDLRYGIRQPLAGLFFPGNSVPDIGNRREYRGI